MSYVSPSGPLPPNSATPCVGSTQYGVENAAIVEMLTAQGRATVQQISPPAAYVGLGLPVAKQVQDASIRLAAAASPVPSQSALMPRSIVAQAPQVVPLNVSESEYNGCCGQVITQPVTVGPQPRISIPQAPIVRETALGPLYLKGSKRPYMPTAATNQAMREPSYNNRGLGAAWGNKGSMPCGPTWPHSGMSGGGWLALAAVAFAGAWVMTSGRR